MFEMIQLEPMLMRLSFKIKNFTRLGLTQYDTNDLMRDVLTKSSFPGKVLVSYCYTHHLNFYVKISDPIKYLTAIGHSISIISSVLKEIMMKKGISGNPLIIGKATQLHCPKDVINGLVQNMQKANFINAKNLYNTQFDIEINRYDMDFKKVLSELRSVISGEEKETLTKAGFYYFRGNETMFSPSRFLDFTTILRYISSEIK